MLVGIGNVPVFQADVSAEAKVLCIHWFGVYLENVNAIMNSYGYSDSAIRWSVVTLDIVSQFLGVAIFMLTRLEG